MTNITITLSAILTPEIEAAISSISDAGYAAGLTTFVIYTRTRGIPDDEIREFMAGIGAADRLVMVGSCPDDVEYADWVAAQTPVVVQAFKDLADGVKTCLHMLEADYTTAIQQDTAKQELAAYLISNGYVTLEQLQPPEGP
ncbi:MAG: hypothetical protein RPU90_04270 [Candidatus Sedimenticola sp. (ex Thyasira tokunagai)]